jgi:hypothetical protein
MKIKPIGLGLTAFFLLMLVTSSTLLTGDPTLPATPYNYSVNLPAHFLTDANGPLPTSVIQ